MNFECLKSQYNSSQLYILNVRDVKFLFGGDLQLNNLLHYLPNIPVPKSDQEIESDLKKKKLKLSKTLSKEVKNHKIKALDSNPYFIKLYS